MSLDHWLERDPLVLRIGAGEPHRDHVAGFGAGHCQSRDHGEIPQLDS